MCFLLYIFMIIYFIHFNNDGRIWNSILLLGIIKNSIK